MNLRVRKIVVGDFNVDMPVAVIKIDSFIVDT